MQIKTSKPDFHSDNISTTSHHQIVTKIVSLFNIIFDRISERQTLFLKKKIGLCVSYTFRYKQNIHAKDSIDF